MSLKGKIVRVVSGILITTVALGTVVVGSMTVGAKLEKRSKTTEKIESSYGLVLKTLNRKHREKVTGIENVETEFVSETEGVVKVYATAETSRGNEYDCSFSFTGDVEKVESIDTKASEIYQKRAEQLTKTGEDLEGSKVMRELLAYIEEIADFVEEYEDTCAYKSETAKKEKITSTITNENGEEVAVEYTGNGVFYRSYEFLAGQGLAKKEEADTYFAKIEDFYKNEDYKFENYVSYDFNNATATVSTDVLGTSFIMTMDISQALSSTKTDEMKKQAQEFVHKFLTTGENVDKIVIKVDTISVYAKSAWTCINNNVDAKLNYESEDSLQS